MKGPQTANTHEQRQVLKQHESERRIISRMSVDVYQGRQGRLREKGDKPCYVCTYCLQQDGLYQCTLLVNSLVSTKQVDKTKRYRGKDQPGKGKVQYIHGKECKELRQTQASDPF